MGNCGKLPRTDSNEEIKQIPEVSRQRTVHVPIQNPQPSNPPLQNNNIPLQHAPPSNIPSHQYRSNGPPPSYSYPMHPPALSQYPAPHNPVGVPQQSANHPFHTQSIPIGNGRLYAASPVVSDAKAVVRFSRIIDEKLTLEPTDNDLHWVNFIYKSTYKSKATIHYFVREGFDRNTNRHYFYANPNTYPKAQSFILDEGNEVKFEYKYKTSFTNVNPQLLSVADKSTYPLVIEIETKNPSNEHDEQVLINCYKIVKEDSNFKASIIKQMIKLEGKYKTITNIFGTSADGNESECLICLTEAKTVAVLPCRHVCYCEECLKEISKKAKNECPVCRAAVSSFLKVHH